jgi:HK97 family phage major capsid protein
MADRETDDKVMEALTELRATVESKGHIDKDKVDRLNEVLDGYEEKNQQLVLVEQKAKNLENDIKDLQTMKQQYEEEKAANDEGAKELKAQINDLEAAVARGVNEQKKNDPDAYKESIEYKAINHFCVEGERALSDEERKALLRTDTAVDGGILVPTELDNVIIKKIIEVDPIRSIARVRTINGKSMEMPIRNTIPVATYEGEAAAGGESASTYESETVTPYRQTHTTPITQDMLMDSAFDMESEITSDAAMAFAFGEGNGFVVGTGVKQPSGFISDARLVADARVGDAAGTSGKVFEDDLIKLTGDLKVGYNPWYVMNRRTLASIRTLKSTTGQFLWMPGLNGPVANTLNGFNYALANSMPDEASGSLSVAFGDFRVGYTIVDRTGMTVVRDELTKKTQAIVEFTMNRWNTGLVVLPEAIKILQLKA